MKVISKITLVFLALVLASCNSNTTNYAVPEAQSLQPEIEKKVDELIAQMSLEEKVGQMIQITLDVVSTESDQPIMPEIMLDTAKLRQLIVEKHVGSILNTANDQALSLENWKEIIATIQEMALNESRLGIPVIYGIDAIHGVNYTIGATLFPQQIGQAATFNRQLVKTAAEITAYETRASHIPWNFSPVLGLGKNPLWPRMWETFGEDEYLISELGVEMIKGYEGDNNNIGDPYKMASCMKHYLGYSFPLSGKDRTPAWIPERELRQYFLEPFRAAVNAGTHTVMICSGEINGTPVHINSHILTDILKHELGFTGLSVTDWADIDYLYSRHKVAKNLKEAIALSINAGIDMVMVPYDVNYADYLVELVNEGHVSMARIDDAVRRVLRVKYKLNLFEAPTSDDSKYDKFGSTEFAREAYNTAVESIVLLKNKNNILPLNKNSKILLAGPNANSMRTLNGGWSYSWQGEKAEYFTNEHNTILEAIKNLIGENNLSYKSFVEYDGANWASETTDFSGFYSMAQGVNAIVLVLGENSYCEKPGDIEDLTLSENQEKLALMAAKTGKPVILVLNEGRPRIINSIEPKMDAVIQTFLPGNYGGDALAAILFGDENPSGKLPYTYPRNAHSFVNYNHKHTEDLDQNVFNPQYEFGDGLSYTTFEYSNLNLSTNELNATDELTISVKVKNTGNISGKESVLMFISDNFASITPSVKQLKGFDKVELKPGEEKMVNFKIKAGDLAFVNNKLEWVAEKGEFTIHINDKETQFTLTETIKK